ncbi:MAG: type I glutamate--ammonia ligase [Anaerolineae bacterium]|jgi:glutamine synthetase
MDAGLDDAKRQVLEQAAQSETDFVHLQFTDLMGIVKAVTIPVSRLEGALTNGVWFDGSSIEGFARIAESDMYLVPDPTTFSPVPWSQLEGTKTARIICDVYAPNGEPFKGDPRGILKRMLAKAEAKGYIFNTGPELEFFLFPLDPHGHVVLEPHDRGGYFDLSTDQAVHVRKDMVNALQQFGIEVEASHHEVGIGQHEIDFRYAGALKSADNAVTFKYALKSVAKKNGLHATFMPKPIYGIAGSGMHTHQSLTRLSDGTNAFSDEKSEYGLSDIALSYIAGQLAHARAMCLVIAPLVNSYKRLVPGYEAPVYVSWGRVNRSALIRVPRVSANNPQATRVELRCPDPACNPYLAFAVALAAGLDGVEKGMNPPAPIEEDIYHLDKAVLAQRDVQTLPGSLEEAITAAEADPLIEEALGSHTFGRLVEAKRQEWDDYRTRVSSWEIERYLANY